MLCNATRRHADGKRVILRQRVRGSVRALRAVRNTPEFLTETRVVAGVCGLRPDSEPDDDTIKASARTMGIEIIDKKQLGHMDHRVSARAFMV
jgi:hypothetical protein